jgi:hypothetical protein
MEMLNGIYMLNRGPTGLRLSPEGELVPKVNFSKSLSPLTNTHRMRYLRSWKKLCTLCIYHLQTAKSQYFSSASIL